VVLCDNKDLASSPDNQASGLPYPTGFLLTAGVSLPVESRGLCWAMNPGASSVQVSVLTERYEPGPESHSDG
jgi:hypothetical protein